MPHSRHACEDYTQCPQHRVGGRVFVVEYTAYKTTLSFTFQDPQPDGIVAAEKALDYYNAALLAPLDADARCVVWRDGELYLDTSWQ